MITRISSNQFTLDAKALETLDEIIVCRQMSYMRELTAEELLSLLIQNDFVRAKTGMDAEDEDELVGRPGFEVTIEGITCTLSDKLITYLTKLAERYDLPLADYFDRLLTKESDLYANVGV
jgi:hypothetical protein